VIAEGECALRTFDYRGVRLLPGMLQQQVSRTRGVYGSIPNDDILKGFRRNAGLPAPGKDMGGWAARSSGDIFGQLLSGMVRLGRATGDDALTEKALALFEGWLQTVPTDGNIGMSMYAFEKLVCGLVDLHLYANCDAALTVLGRVTAWAANTFDRSRNAANEFDFWGEYPADTHEWYTLPENLYRAYLASDNAAFKDFADIWRYEQFWDRFADTAEPTGVPPVHAYSHVNTLSSAAMTYARLGMANGSSCARGRAHGRASSGSGTPAITSRSVFRCSCGWCPSTRSIRTGWPSCMGRWFWRCMKRAVGGRF
jgi:uncharacterized protein